MEKKQFIIVAHSIQQYDKCQRYLNGQETIGSMYPLMITYYNETMSLFHLSSINEIPDEEVAKKFCEHIKPPTYA